MRSRLLRKSILERLKYFVREGQVQKLKKKKNRNNFTIFTVHNAGPGLRAKKQSYHQISSSPPSVTRMQAKVSLQQLSPDLVCCHSKSRACSSKVFFPLKTGQKKPAFCAVEEHLTARIHRAWQHISFPKFKKYSQEKVEQMFQICSSLRASNCLRPA